MRNTEEKTREYMSKYMKKKYIENKEAINTRNRLNYELKKNAIFNLREKIHNNINKIVNDIALLTEHNKHNEEYDKTMENIAEEVNKLLKTLQK